MNDGFAFGWWLAWILLLSTLYSLASAAGYGCTTLRGSGKRV